MKKLLLFIGIVFAGFTLQAQVVVNPNPNPLYSCDDNNDGFAFFDLQQADADITLGDMSLMVSYYETLSDASNGLFPIYGIYNNTVPYQQTVYARADNSQGDFAIAQLDLIVVDSPTPAEPTPFLVGEIDNDGIELFDFTLKDNEIINGEPNVSVHYYENYNDAVNGTPSAELSSPYQNTVPFFQIIYARATNSITACSTVVPLELIVAPLPPIINPIDLVVSDSDGDGIEIFDLTVNDAIMLQGLNPMDFSVTYYELESDAEEDINPIVNPTAYQNIENPQTIYVRVTDISSGLYVTTSFLISTDVLSVNAFIFDDLNVFPNPTSANFTVQSSLFGAEIVISLYDILGKKLRSEKIHPKNGTASIDISSFKNGVYLIKISSEGNETVRRLIKG